LRASMVRFPLSFIFASVVLCGFTSTALAFSPVPDPGHPVVFGLDGGILLPGQTVHFTVTLSGPADGTEVIAVSTNGAFSSIPTYLHPQPGDTSVGFYATLRTDSLYLPTVTVSEGDVSLTQVLPLIEVLADDATFPVSTIDDSMLP
jgi:hypothetical protein